MMTPPFCDVKQKRFFTPPYCTLLVLNQMQSLAVLYRSSVKSGTARNLAEWVAGLFMVEMVMHFNRTIVTLLCFWKRPYSFPA